VVSYIQASELRLCLEHFHQNLNYCAESLHTNLRQFYFSKHFICSAKEWTVMLHYFSGRKY